MNFLDWLSVDRVRSNIFSMSIMKHGWFLGQPTSTYHTCYHSVHISGSRACSKWGPEKGSLPTWNHIFSFTLSLTLVTEVRQLTIEDTILSRRSLEVDEWTHHDSSARIEKIDKRIAKMQCLNMLLMQLFQVRAEKLRSPPLNSLGCLEIFYLTITPRCVA